MLFACGAGESDADIKLVTKNDLPRLIEQGVDLSFLVAVP